MELNRPSPNDRPPKRDNSEEGGLPPRADSRHPGTGTDVKTPPPKTRTEWRQAKFDRNVSNHRKQQAALKERGWHVIIVWKND
ncbi:hypothetical protein P4C99_11300 [Pontiellaceae bacterium B1224]|nr:hypothetical protein [Pontiellaceae bacterium B1224]